jgi:hypothetical protein
MLSAIDHCGGGLFSMHRLTARILLILSLAGIFAPLALAISTPAPHACCMRKPMASENPVQQEVLASPTCCNHDCCRVVVTSQWAKPAQNSGQPCFWRSSELALQSAITRLSFDLSDLHSGRSPPHFSMI